MILYPYVTEKATIQSEKLNLLHFIVGIDNNKEDVKKEIEELYKVKVKKVNMMITFKGKKKAIVTFQEPNAAVELASKIGIF